MDTYTNQDHKDISSKLRDISEFLEINAYTLNITDVNHHTLYQASTTIQALDNVISYQIEGLTQVNFKKSNNVFELTGINSDVKEVERFWTALQQAVRINGSTISGMGTKYYYVSMAGQWNKCNINDLFQQ